MMPALKATKDPGFTAEEFVAATEALIQRGYFKGEAVEAAEMIRIILAAAATARGRGNRCLRHGVINCKRC